MESESDEEAYMASAAERATTLPNYKPPNGDFESFPQLHAKTIDKLKRNGIVNLFPIQ